MNRKPPFRCRQETLPKDGRDGKRGRNPAYLRMTDMSSEYKETVPILGI